jgi:hypothetical protein
VYQAIGDYMSKYKSGKLPKAFKIIPSLTNWQEVGFFFFFSLMKNRQGLFLS